MQLRYKNIKLKKFTGLLLSFLSVLSLIIYALGLLEDIRYYPLLFSSFIFMVSGLYNLLSENKVYIILGVEEISIREDKFRMKHIKYNEVLNISYHKLCVILESKSDSTTIFYKNLKKNDKETLVSILK